MARPPVPIPTFGGKQLWMDRFLYAGWRIQTHVLTGQHRLLDPGLRAHAWGSWEECCATFDRLREQRALRRRSEHLVVLLHGIFRAAEAWRPMARALLAAGYEPAAVTYPSTQRGIELHADQVEEVLERAEDVTRVSFVTHSMGGLVAREVLGRDAPWRRRLAVNRLVMIATPNRGAVLADRLVALKAFREVAGPAGLQLTTDYVPTLPEPSCPFGVIAGVRGDGHGFNPLLPGEDDMTVTVDSALLDGAEDTLLVPGAIHTFILQRPDVIAATLRYLDSGRFSEAEPAGSSTG